MTDPIVWSSSSLKTLLTCGQMFYFAHIERIKEKPRVRLLIGNAAHTAAETNLEQKITSEVDLPMDSVLDSFSTAFDAGIKEVTTPEELPGPAKDSGLALVKLYHNKVSPLLQPAAVEEKVQFTINGRTYATTLDVRTTRDDVLDLKTTQRKPNPSNHAFQVIGGAVAFRQKTGRTERDAGLDFLIRKKKPEYLPIRWGPITNQAIGVFSKQIEYAENIIKRGDFVANGIASYACSWCGYTQICPAYRAAFGSRPPDTLLDESPFQAVT